MGETYHSNVIGCFIWELQKTSWRRANRTSLIEVIIVSNRRRTNTKPWWCTTETSLGVSFETCLRDRGDVLIRRRHYVPMRRHHDVPIRRREYVPLRRYGDVPLTRCWAFTFRHTFHVTGTNRETSLPRCQDILLPGGFFQKSKFEIPYLGVIVIIHTCMYVQMYVYKNS